MLVLIRPLTHPHSLDLLPSRFPPSGEALTTPGGIINAKLFVTCVSKPEVPPWVFYLRGMVGAATGGAAVPDTAPPAKSGKK